MKQIPRTQNALVLRADFSDESTWQLVCTEVRTPVGEFQAYVEFFSDPSFEGVGVDQLVLLRQEPLEHSFMFVVDHVTITNPDHPILVVDLREGPGRTFRVVPSEAWGVENNLSVGNMDFEEFADHVDSDGVFRGFPKG